MQDRLGEHLASAQLEVRVHVLTYVRRDTPSLCRLADRLHNVRATQQKLSAEMPTATSGTPTAEAEQRHAKKQASSAYDAVVVCRSVATHFRKKKPTPRTHTSTTQPLTADRDLAFELFERREKYPKWGCLVFE